MPISSERNVTGPGASVLRSVVKRLCSLQSERPTAFRARIRSAYSWRPSHFLVSKRQIANDIKSNGEGSPLYLCRQEVGDVEPPDERLAAAPCGLNDVPPELHELRPHR